MRKILLACLLSVSVWAAESNVYKVTYKVPVDKVIVHFAKNQISLLLKF